MEHNISEKPEVTMEELEQQVQKLRNENAFLVSLLKSKDDESSQASRNLTVTCEESGNKIAPKTLVEAGNIVNPRITPNCHLLSECVNTLSNIESEHRKGRPKGQNLSPRKVWNCPRKILN